MPGGTLKKVTGLGREWVWPDADTKCLQVIFDTLRDMDYAYEWVKKFGVAVQAGGNVGVWPWRMAKRFKQVHTFEPDPRCWPLLQQNLAGVENIEGYNSALWWRETTCDMRDEAANNLGAQFILPGTGRIPCMKLDRLALGECDLIYLDVEGAEYGALKGAVETIGKHLPVIVVEDKGLSEKYGTRKGDIEKWLAAEFGYRVVARPHRDVVMVPA